MGHEHASAGPQTCLVQPPEQTSWAMTSGDPIGGLPTTAIGISLSIQEKLPPSIQNSRDARELAVGTRIWRLERFDFDPLRPLLGMDVGLDIVDEESSLDIGTWNEAKILYAPLPDDDFDVGEPMRNQTFVCQILCESAHMHRSDGCVNHEPVKLAFDTDQKVSETGSRKATHRI